MDFTGISGKYPDNRPINAFERQHHLAQKQRINRKPLYQRSVIKANSTYLELVDKFYGWRGTSSTIGLIFFGMSCPMIASAILQILFSYKVHSFAESWFYIPLFGFLFYVFFLLSRMFVRMDSFGYTHFPMRFNRQDRMVYIFRPGHSGEVFSAPWDEIHFCINELPRAFRSRSTFYEVQGLIHNDHDVVQETFSLSTYTSKASFDILEQHWELVRRYMEEGPDDVLPHIQSYLPLHERKETLYEGFSRFMAEIGGHTVFFPLFFLIYIVMILPGRCFGLIFNKIPQWPQWVEDACQIDPDDPNWRDYKTHPFERDWDKDHQRTVPANQPLYPPKPPKTLWYGVEPIIVIIAAVVWGSWIGGWLLAMWI